MEKRQCYECGKVGHLAKNCPLKDNSTRCVRKQVSFGDESGRSPATEFGVAQQARFLLARQDGVSNSHSREGINKSRNESYCSKHLVSLIDRSCEECVSSRRSQQCTKRCMSSRGGKIDESGDVFLLDFGASDHMVVREDWLQDCRSIKPRGIVLGDGKRGFATHCGTLVLRTIVSAGSQHYVRFIVLKHAL